MPNDTIQPNTEPQISQPIRLQIEPTFARNEEPNEKTNPQLNSESILAKYLTKEEL